MSERLIPRDKSVVVAADVTSENLPALIRGTCAVEGIGGYKIGIELALEQGLPRIVGSIREHTDLPIIYDHQKAGNDIPDMGSKFSSVCKNSGVDAVILFPFAGNVTAPTWIKAAKDAGLHVLVGGEMTHPGFTKKEGGFISKNDSEKIYRIAAENGVRDFVVPGNKAESVKHYHSLLEQLLGADNFTLYAPGFITQGGEISEFAQAAGDRWHAIVGSAIYKAMDMQSAAEMITREIK